jgi:N-methylhydantoinase A
LKVGPQSAGADPGPACYGRGEQPTVTDADLLLGRLAADAFLGGRMVLDVERARAAVGRLAGQLRMDVEQAADGIVRVVNAGMERAIRRISVERGHDPRDYTLVAFGGAAGMHACALAAALAMTRVLVPVHPGLLSAWGAAVAEVRRDYVQTVRLLAPAPRTLVERVRALAGRARRELRAEGAPAGLRVAASLDVRYRGQSYELRIPLSPRYRANFHRAHRRQYGYADEQRAVEVVNVRVSATAPGGPRGRRPIVAEIRAAQSSRNGLHSHRLHWNGRWGHARSCTRDALPRRRIDGPLIITEISATTVVPPDWTARVLPTGDLLLERR